MRYRYLRRTVIAAVGAIALLLGAGLLAVRVVESEPVARRLRVIVERAGAAALGGPVEIGSLRLQVVPPRVVLHDLEVRSPAGEASLDRLAVDLAGIRLLRRTLELDAVAVRGLRLRPGGRQLPAPGGGGGWLRLRVRQLEVVDLAVEGVQLSGRVTFSASGVDAAWSVSDGPPRGYLRVASAELGVPGLERTRLAVEARLRWSDGLEIPRWRVRSEEVELAGRGRVGRAGEVALEAEGEVDLAELDRVVRSGARLAGRARVDLELTREDGPPRVTAEVAAPAVSVAGFELAALRGRLELARGGLVGTLDRASWAGGELRGRYRLERLGPPFAHLVEVEGDGLGLARLLSALGVPETPVAAEVDARVELGWRGSRIREGTGVGLAELTPGAGAIPGGGRIRVDLEGDGVLRFASEQLRLGGSAVTWQGPLRLGSWEPGWSIRAEPAVVEELAVLVNSWSGSEVIPERLSGRGSVQVTLAGPWRGLEVEVRADLERAAYPPVELDGVVGEARWRDGVLELGPARFAIGPSGGEVEGRLTTAPGGGSGTGVELAVRARDVPLAAIASWSGVPEGVGGVISLAGVMGGTVTDPSGSAAVALVDVEVLGTPLGSGSAVLEIADHALAVRGLELSGGAAGEGVWRPGAGVVEGRVRWPGMPTDLLGAAAPPALGPNADLAGSFRLAGDVPATGRLEVVGAEGRVEVESTPAGVEGSLRLGDAADARVVLDRTAGGGLAGVGTVAVGDVAAVLARLGLRGGVPLTGRAHASLEVEWPPAERPRVRALFETLDLDLGGRPVELIEPARLEVGPGGVSLPGVRLALLGDEVFARGGMDADGALRGNLSGTVDALLLRFLAPGWEPAGRVTGVVELLGSLERPVLEGVARVTEGSFRIPGSREVISGIDGTALFSREEVVLEGMSFRFMRGVGTGRGRIRIDDGVPRLLLEGAVRDLEYQLFPGLEPRLAGSFRLEGPVDDLALSGDLEVRQATLRRRDELAAIISDWFLTERPPGEGGGGLELDLTIEADRTLEARSPFVRLVGSASLLLTGTSENPGLVGSVEFMEGGDFTFQGVRYELDRGVITFSDPARIDPYLDLAARGWIDTTQVSVRVTGTLDRLVPVVTSDPPLPESQLLSMMAFGRSGEGLGGTTLGLGVASTLLARQLNTEIERRARELVPIDQVRIDPFAEVSTGNPTARVTLVKQLSPSWSLMLQTNLSTNREEVVVLRWFLGQGLFVEATRDIDGSVGLDIKLRRRY